MTEKIVELIRRFTPMSARSRDWDFLMPEPGRTKLWHEIKDQFRVLIIADPGAGKTFEAQTRARKMKEHCRHAFFIRIEKIDANFEQAFEVGTALEFASWLASTEEAWFFLDSVDEAQLETPRALEDAVRVFGAKIHAALDRAHIFITSREDAWRALPDQTLIEQHLPYGEPDPAGKDDDSSRDSDPTLKLFRLVGLTEDEIALFAGHYDVSEVPDFVDAVKRANLLGLAERPFDLKALIRQKSIEISAPIFELRPRLNLAIVGKRSLLRAKDLANRVPGNLQVPGDLLDRLALDEMFPPHPADRLHYDHPHHPLSTRAGRLPESHLRGSNLHAE